MLRLLSPVLGPFVFHVCIVKGHCFVHTLEHRRHCPTAFNDLVRWIHDISHMVEVVSRVEKIFRLENRVAAWLKALLIVKVGLSTSLGSRMETLFGLCLLGKELWDFLRWLVILLFLDCAIGGVVIVGCFSYLHWGVHSVSDMWELALALYVYLLGRLLFKICSVHSFFRPWHHGRVPDWRKGVVEPLPSIICLRRSELSQFAV